MTTTPDPHDRRPSPAGAAAVAGVLFRIVTGDWATLDDDASAIRVEVFVREQRIPARLEWDEWDPASLHCVAYDGLRPVGTGRLLPDGHVGRMAVLAEYRRAGVGGRVLGTLVAAARARGERELRLNAQSYAQAFYERHGFVARGEHFLEAGIDHVAMARALR